MRKFSILLALVLGLAWFLPSIQPVSAAGYVDGREIFKMVRDDIDVYGYYESSDTIRLFSSDAVRQINRNGGLHPYGTIVPDTKNKNVVYFVTNEKLGDSHYRTRVNSYNLKSKRLTIIYTQDITATDDNMYWAGYVAFGMDGGKLVVRPLTDNSPAPCANDWTAFDYDYLDVTHPQAGFKSYSVPNYLIQKGEAESRICEVNI